MLPRPTADPAAASMKPARLPQWARSSAMDGPPVRALDGVGFPHRPRIAQTLLNVHVDAVQDLVDVQLIELGREATLEQRLAEQVNKSITGVSETKVGLPDAGPQPFAAGF